MSQAPQSGAALADRFSERNQQVIACVLGPARAVWLEESAEEGWPVGVVARHIALWHDRLLDWVRAVKLARPILPPDPNALNAADAAAGVVAGPDEVASLLRLHGLAVAAALRDLSPEDLAGEVDFGGEPRPARQLCQVVVDHPARHLASIEAVIAGRAGA